MITRALEAMFTWHPGRDTSSGDALTRATPYLSDRLAAQVGEPSEGGPGAQWDQWAAAEATVTARALIVADDHPPDTPDLINRVVAITQTVTAPDATELDQIHLTAWVTAIITPAGWRVDTVDF